MMGKVLIMIRLYNGSVPLLHYVKCSKLSNTFWGVASLKFKVLLNFLVTIKAAPHECVIGTGQP